jgi:hypothetical protein
MKIISKFVEKIAYVDTDEGCFRVFDDGSMGRWMDDEVTHQGYYGWFDEDKYSDEDIAEIRRLGLELLK